MRVFYNLARPADILDLVYMHPGGVHIYILTESRNCLVRLLIGWRIWRSMKSGLIGRRMKSMKSGLIGRRASTGPAGQVARTQSETRVEDDGSSLTGLPPSRRLIFARFLVENIYMQACYA